MELQKIKQLIDVLAASDLAELELVEGDHRVRLVRRLVAVPESFGRLAAVSSNAVSAPLPAAPAGSGPDAAEPAGQVTAPLYGVLHLTPSPDAPAFVRLGDSVQPGQTLCVVEAMKMFHEVKAPRGGIVAAILAVAGEEVEAGTALFRLLATE
jgi:acetyl-CoA carboxylase biotin carboxyl carrier protein